MVHSLNLVHSYPGVFDAACIKWSRVVHRVNPVSHFWVILNHSDCGPWQVHAVFDTLKDTWTQSWFVLKNLEIVCTVLDMGTQTRTIRSSNCKVFRYTNLKASALYKYKLEINICSRYKLKDGTHVVFFINHINIRPPARRNNRWVSKLFSAWRNFCKTMFMGPLTGLTSNRLNV